MIDDRLLDTRALAIPAEVISCLRKAAYRELASASEEVLVIAQTSSHLVHPEEYEDAFARLDGTRALLNDLGWVDIGEPRSGVRINVATLGASLLTVLDRAYTCARRTELSRLSDLLGNLQSTLKDRLEAHADNPVGTMIQRQLALPRPRVPLSELTRRESEVLAHLSRSRSYGEIAVSLSIDVETVRTHARRVRRKLGVRTSRELAGVYIAESEDT